MLKQRSARVLNAFVVVSLTLVLSASATVRLIQSDEAADRLKEKTPIKEFSAVNATIQVTSSAKHQRVIGFGAAVTQAAANVFAKAPTTVQQQLLNWTFGPDGHRYNLARVPVGSSDFATEHYDYASVKGDARLLNFSIDHDRADVIPLLLKAKIMTATTGQELRLLASPWSAPPWMKNIENYRCVYEPLCTGCSLKDEHKETYASYLSMFLDAYRGEGLPIWGLTVQNEPENCPNNYEGMHFTPETQRDFLVNELGPLLRNHHPDTKIFAYDHNKDHLVKWADAILGDPVAAQFVDGIAFHWYSGDQFENVETVRKSFPGTLLLATEACQGGDKKWNASPDWSNGEGYAHDIIGDLRSGAQSWIDWNVWLEAGHQKDGYHFGPSHYGPIPDTGGNNAPLVVDMEEGKVYPQAMYWYLGHFSRFIQAEAQVIDSSCGAEGLECVAVTNPDGSLVVVAMNTQASSIEYDVSIVNLGRQTQKIRIPARGIQTLVFEGLDAFV